MPVAILFNAQNITPRIFSEDTDDALLERLNALGEAPPLSSVEDAELWLESLLSPSGWFSSIAAAQAHLSRVLSEEAPDMTGAEVREAREGMGLTRAAFALKLGYGGNDNTRHKAIFEVEIGKKPLNIERCLKLRALIAKHRMSKAPANLNG